MWSTSVLFWVAVILTMAVAHDDGTFNAEHDDIPTVQECRPHIEAALKLYQSGALNLDDSTAVNDHDSNQDSPDNEEINDESSNSQENESELQFHSPNEANDDAEDPHDDDGDNEIDKRETSQRDDDNDGDEDNEINSESPEDGHEIEDQSDNRVDDDQDNNDDEDTDIQQGPGNEKRDTEGEEQDAEGEEQDSEKITTQDSEGTDDTEENADDTEENADDSEENADDTKENADDTEENADDTEGNADYTEEDADDTKQDSEDTAQALHENTDDESESKEPEQAQAEQPDEDSDNDLDDDEVQSTLDAERSDEPSNNEEWSTDTDNDENESESLQGANQLQDRTGDDEQEEIASSDSTDENEVSAEEIHRNDTTARVEVLSDGDTTEVEEQNEEDDNEEEKVTVAGPGLLRTREHIESILRLDKEGIATAAQKERASAESLRNLKRMFEATVKPLEGLYKFKDISNRHLGDAELFSQPIIVFLGPLGSGKSTIVNYLLGLEDTQSAIKTGTDHNSNVFNVLMFGDSEQSIDGTQLAADWAFSSLQKFGQSFLDRLRGRKLPKTLLRKVTVVDTPGVSEHRKSNERLYPFNDACQWFIDRADLIFVVFDPFKLDLGLELEALFDQLKGRESHVRILLNKADNVSPVELMRAQSTLLWNLSPLVGTPDPPTVFAGSFWSRPYLPNAATELLYSSEVALLEDIHDAVENRVENKVALARRHAVRVRNHAKMVDCYLNTYYNHKSFFSNKRKVADEIVDNPHMYRIYEGLSTLANVSRYDLPDPDVYRDFFRLNPLFDFKPLASTCSYFKGCPLDKLDITIAYDLPELVGKYHKALKSIGAQ